MLRRSWFTLASLPLVLALLVLLLPLGASPSGAETSPLPAQPSDHVVDVSNPADPKEVSFYATDIEMRTRGVPYGVAVVGNYVYLAVFVDVLHGNGHGGLRVVDVSDPANPTEAGVYYTPRGAISVAVAGELVYVADGPPDPVFEPGGAGLYT